MVSNSTQNFRARKIDAPLTEYQIALCILYELKILLDEQLLHRI